MQETACENLSNGTTEIYDIDVFWMFHSSVGIPGHKVVCDYNFHQKEKSFNYWTY